MTTKYLIKYEHLTAKLSAKELELLKARYAPITKKCLVSAAQQEDVEDVWAYRDAPCICCLYRVHFCKSKLGTCPLRPCGRWLRALDLRFKLGSIHYGDSEISWSAQDTYNVRRTFARIRRVLEAAVPVEVSDGQV